MRKILTAIAIFCLVTLSTVSDFCVGDPETFLVDASENSIDIEDAKNYDPDVGICQVTLNGSWYLDETNENEQDYVVSYGHHRGDASRTLEILVVDEVYDWTIEEDDSFHFFFPDPGDASDNLGAITLTFRYGSGPWFLVEGVIVTATENSISIADGYRHEFLSGGKYELVTSGVWYIGASHLWPQRYMLAYYDGPESKWSETLVVGSQQSWNVGSGADAYFYMPVISSSNHGNISVEIDAVQDQGLTVWWLDPVWIAIWVAIASIVVGVIGVMVSRKVRE
jgi:hypothetical protein